MPDTEHQSVSQPHPCSGKANRLNVGMGKKTRRNRTVHPTQECNKLVRCSVLVSDSDKKDITTKRKTISIRSMA